MSISDIINIDIKDIMDISGMCNFDAFWDYFFMVFSSPWAPLATP